MKLYYRISDNSFSKPKLPGATKEACFENFCYSFSKQVFGFQIPPTCSVKDMDGKKSALRIIADKCERKLSKYLVNTGLPVTLTQLGNSGSLRKAIEMALEECDDDDVVYFSEDDYLHKKESPKLIQEIADRADYFTLYDHPDKYTQLYDNGEVSKVIRTASSHWRFTKSTCMTFGTKVGTLKTDKEVWWKYTESDVPQDHLIFEELEKELAVCVPGAACHTDLTFSGVAGQVLMERWAIEMMILQMEHSLGVGFSPIDTRDPWERLVYLDSIRFAREKGMNVLKPKESAC